MKRKIAVILAVVLAFALIVACADNYGWVADPTPASADSVEMAFATPVPAPAMPPPAFDPPAEPLRTMEAYMAWDMVEDDSFVFAEEGGYVGIEPPIGTLSSNETAVAGGGSQNVADSPSSFAEMIIRTVDARIETLNFDESIENVNLLIANHGAFVENSNISGINHEAQQFGWNVFRSANFTLRVPAQDLDAMVLNLSVLGNVVNQWTSADNITMQFHDTQSRLNSLRIQEERLLDMLSRADYVPDLIAIEERLGDVRMQVEAFQTTINVWQNRVSYSTIHLNIWEVEVFTEVVEPRQLTYWERVGEGFMNTLRSIGNFFMNLFMWFVVNIPVFIILAVVAVIATVFVKKCLKKRKDRRKAKAEQSENAE